MKRRKNGVVECWSDGRKGSHHSITPSLHRRRSGLTLIEVLLAIAILGIGLIVLVAAAGKCLSLARKAHNYETARELLARVQVESPIEAAEEIEDVEDSGDFGSEFSGWTWKRELEKVGLEEQGLFKITTTVFWSENRHESSESLVTLKYDAKAAGKAGGRTR